MRIVEKVLQEILDHIHHIVIISFKIYVKSLIGPTGLEPTWLKFIIDSINTHEIN